MDLRIYQLIPAIAIQDHLLRPMRAASRSPREWPASTRASPRRSSALAKLGREGVRLAGQAASLGEWTYQKAILRLKTTIVGVG